MNLALIIGLVVMLVATPVILVIGMNIYYSVYSTISTLNLGSGNTTRTNIDTNVWSSFSLMSIVPLLLGASAIISILVTAFVYVIGRRG